MSFIQADRVKETTTTTGTGNVTLAGAATGYEAFSANMANTDTCFYCIAGQTTAEWEVGLGTFVSATPALARTTVFASSNANALVSFSAGTKDVFITALAERLALPEMTADPPAPASGVLFYTRKLGGRNVPRFIGPSGIDSAVQPAMFANNVTMWLPGTSSTAAINFGVSWTVGATQATPAIATTNFMAQMRRATFTTTTTSGNAAGVTSAAAVCWRGNAAGLGGFFFAARFGVLTFQSAMAIRVGLSAQTTILAASPSTVANSCYVGKDHADTNWFCVTVDNTPTANKAVTTGHAVAAAATNECFDFYMYCKPNDTQITFRFVDISPGTVYVDNVSTTLNLPANTQLLTAHAECRAGSAAAVAIFLNKIYIESDN
jgi:hypothetical protein